MRLSLNFTTFLVLGLIVFNSTAWSKPESDTTVLSCINKQDLLNELATPQVILSLGDIPNKLQFRTPPQKGYRSFDVVSQNISKTELGLQMSFFARGQIEGTNEVHGARFTIQYTGQTFENKFPGEITLISQSGATIFSNFDLRCELPNSK